MKVGCSEEVLEVPLFAELYGYGMFAGRRNQGAHDPLYCRAFSFNDGMRRAVIVYTDTCTTDDFYAREMRAKIVDEYHIEPGCIAFVATHTHSAPPLGIHCGVGFGEPNPEFQKTWKRAVMKTVGEALRNEEEIVAMQVGAAPLAQKLGFNRIDKEKNVTDESIRWARFLRADGSCKVLLHSHGVHGVSMNLPFHRLLSADWMGAANRFIKERKLAEMPLFLLAPCGDVNTYTSCRELQDDTAADLIASHYMADLEKSIAAGSEKTTELTIRGTLKSLKFPTVEQTAEELLCDAEIFNAAGDVWHAKMLEEMAIRLRNGNDLSSIHDLQVIRIGVLSLFFIPGEYFVEDGARLMARSVSDHCFAATVSNGNGTYFPSESDMKQYPDIASKQKNKNNCNFGFYEIYTYPMKHRFKYQQHIAEFVASQLLAMEESL